MGIYPLCFKRDDIDLGLVEMKTLVCKFSRAVSCNCSFVSQPFDNHHHPSLIPLIIHSYTHLHIIIYSPTQINQSKRPGN